MARERTTGAAIAGDGESSQKREISAAEARDHIDRSIDAVREWDEPAGSAGTREHRA